MTGQVQRGTGVRAYPSAVRIRDLGRPKKTRKLVFHHSRVSREAETLAPQRGTANPSTPLTDRLGQTHTRNRHYRLEIAVITYDRLPTPYWWEPQKPTRRGHCTRPRRNPRGAPWPEDRTRPGER
jgi:hypothetical protein